MGYKKFLKVCLIGTSVGLLSTMNLSLVPVNKQLVNHQIELAKANSLQNFNQNSINLNRTVITSIVDSSKDTDYPNQNEYTNKRAAGNDFNLLEGLWHTSAKPLMVASINVKQMFGYENIDQFFNDYIAINLEYIFHTNFWYSIYSNKKWLKNYTNNKKVSFDQWEHENFVIDKNTCQQDKFQSNTYRFYDLEFNDIRMYRWTPPRQEEGYVASGVHLWHKRVNNNQTIQIFAETGAFFHKHPREIKLATYMNFRAENIRLVKKR